MDNTPVQTIKFSDWLAQTVHSQKTGEAVDVPCGPCNACCTSSYFVHIMPGDKQAMSLIPAELLFTAPGMPVGHYVLGYNEKGLCPMFVKDKCSIYDSRPRTCRTYDCRIFAATGFSVSDDKKQIAVQSARWRFTFSSEEDTIKYNAVRQAAGFIIQNAGLFPPGFIPSNIPQQAMVAIKAHVVFLEGGSNDAHGTVSRVIDACEKFDRDRLL